MSVCYCCEEGCDSDKDESKVNSNQEQNSSCQWCSHVFCSECKTRCLNGFQYMSKNYREKFQDNLLRSSCRFCIPVICKQWWNRRQGLEQQEEWDMFNNHKMEKSEVDQKALASILAYNERYSSTLRCRKRCQAACCKNISCTESASLTIDLPCTSDTIPFAYQVVLCKSCSLNPLEWAKTVLPICHSPNIYDLKKLSKEMTTGSLKIVKEFLGRQEHKNSLELIKEICLFYEWCYSPSFHIIPRICPPLLLKWFEAHTDRTCLEWMNAIYPFTSVLYEYLSNVDEQLSQLRSRKRKKSLVELKALSIPLLP
jgi:hypothetical protein